MDQDSSNGAGPDKRNWRERLGIGAKELPKLSDEFRDENAPPATPAPGAAKPAPRAPQPVAKPAPMAPRAGQAKPAQPAGEGQPSAAPAAGAPVSRATPKAPDNATQDALAEKLRAQRAAAERLAEQRVQAARNRAETKPAKPEPSRPAAAPPPRTPGIAPRTPGAAPAAGAARPKFSFADDNRDTGRGITPPPLTPPRPALGGERGQPPFIRPSAGGVNGGLGARPQPAFRPSGEGSSNYLAPPRLQAPGASRTGLGSEAAGYGAARVPARRAPPIDPYARQPEPREYAEDDYEDEARAAPRLGRPGGSRGRALQDDYEEVFEDEQAPRGRAGARDYQSAYADGEEGFADEPRRSGGPWLLLLALLAAAVLTGAVVWYYSDNVRNLAGVGSSSTSTSGTPVVPAPEDPAKVAAPDAATDSSQGEAPAARKKQIYDRIVGDQEVTGQMQPTEEAPVPPTDAQPASAAPADQVPKIEPAGNANQIPAPDAPGQGTTGQGLPEVEPPPPLPIPGSDQQGNLGLKGTTGQQVAAASATPEEGATAPPPPPGTQQASSSDASNPPPPEKATDGAASVSDLISGPGTGTATVTPEPDTPAKPKATTQATPPKKKTPPAKKNTTSQPDYNNLGSAPVVLVPPSKQAVAESQAAPVTTAPATQADAPATQAAAPQKRKSIFDLFNGSGATTGTTTGTAGGTTAPATTTAPAQPTKFASAAQQTKQAPAPAPATPAPAPAQPAVSGYVIQLASFRTDSEAKAEYSRLAKSYPSVVGPLKSQIRQTTVGGSTRYQLGLGPMPTRGDATRVCGELIAAGESDCIVRGP